MPDRKVFHMRMVASSAPVPIENDVCIDVVFRGAEADIMAIMPSLRAHMDVGAGLYGNWAGIGRGEFVAKVELA